ncbi:tricorn protease [Phycisphaerales bacterium]|nr:tricorn protease [Phycisphaerales bacterium]
MKTSQLRCAGAWSVVAAAGAASSVLGQVAPHAGMLRWPDVSATHIVFSYANDLWIVPRAGGMAAPLASPPGAESYPKFSPDGKSIAFGGNYDGSRDLYTIPVEGGVPTRVTYHPAGEALCDWTPDGAALHFTSNGLSGLGRQTWAFTVPASGGMFERLPVPYSGFGAISPDGTWLAYTPHSTDTRTWKRYRGGMATDIWLFNLKDNTSKRITNWEGTDTLPMWVPGGDGRVVYYLSDQGPEHRLNIWSCTVGTGERTQVTKFTDDDVRWPSMGPGANKKGEIVFQLGASLMLLDLGTAKSAEVKVTIPGDRPKLKVRNVDTSSSVSGASISPSGKRVAIEARGDVWSAPAKEGVIRNLTRTDGIAERSPSWSPDGKLIAYFSDETGENELWVRASDAKPPEKKDDKKDEKKEDKSDDAKGNDKPADEAAQDETPKPEPKPQPRKLTNLGAGYRFGPTWSPDSKMIAFTDQGGRIFVSVVESGETKELDKDPWMNGPGLSWSSDSKWIAYTRSDEGNGNGVVWIADAKSGEKHQITTGMFAAAAPAFDRKGDWLFYRSALAVNNPEYSDLDSTYAYRESEVILMTPLRKDVKSPFLPKSDEETLKKDDAKKDDKKKDEAKKDEKKDEEKKNGDDKKQDAKPDDGVTGTWSGTAKGNSPEMAAGLPFTMTLNLEEGGALNGTINSVMGGGPITGHYDKASGEITFSFSMGEAQISLKGKVANGEASGTWEAGEDKGDWTAKRSSDQPEDKKDGDGEKKDEAAKEVKIDFDGMEGRSIQLPIQAGNFGGMAVADGEKLIFSRQASRSGSDNGIRVYEYAADEKEEKAVTGGGGWELSADGKKLLVTRGDSIVIHDASAGGGKAQNVSTKGMTAQIDPRREWKQIFDDAWRIMRDYFYEPTMHGVDWAGMKKHYGAMLEDAASREDVNWIISEMISELNIGHAYLGNPGDVEGQPSVGVGMLGCDFALEKTDAGSGYKITKIYSGGVWDADARGPLSQPGVDVKEGDFLLAVNGVPVDTTRDPWAALVGTAGQVVSLTVNAAPAMDGKEREVLVKPASSESTLRYRAYIESKRAYVAEKSGGTIGYIYVPNTGVDGQNDLYRQFFGQRGTQALIIDERWNGGGQIPTRFIELLNRPTTNFWARREGIDWPWPPDAHWGPKCMLINGLAGSGGDMFPWLFRHNKLGPLIGMRTWGGLVGISGNPAFVDGGTITVPTFGFYEADGTWGVEGHGTDADIEVIDDPALMTNGGDPQLDRAIAEMQRAVKEKPFVRPARPASPNRKGMGIEPKDK